jgi:Rieske Fe-S protein
MALSRRRLLVVGGGALCAQIVGCGGGEIVLDPNIAAGQASAVAVGSLTPIAGKSVAIGRDAGGIYAISLVCTHSGCDIAQSGGSVGFGSIECGCHGSIFDGQGNVRRGPASRPLPHLAVTQDMVTGLLTIHGDQVTGADTRLQI